MTEDWNTSALLTVLYIDLLECCDVIGMQQEFLLQVEATMLKHLRFL